MTHRNLRRVDRSKWRPMRCSSGVVHHAIKLYKQEAEYIFRLADVVRAVVACPTCGAHVGKPCLRKDGVAMKNHTGRILASKLIVKERYEPLFGNLYQPICTMEGGAQWFTKDRADDEDVDCMMCLVMADTLLIK